MEQEYSRPFIESTKEMLSTMVGVSCELGEGAAFLSSETISGTIFFHGESNGQVTLSFPIVTARKIVSEMLGMEENEMDDETLRDGVGEMANIVAGNVKAALSSTQYRFLLSLPEIHSGPGVVPDGIDKGEDCLLTDFGEFPVIYWLAISK